MSNSASLQNLELALIELEYAVANLAHEKASATNQTEIVRLEKALSTLQMGKETLNGTLRILEQAGSSPERARFGPSSRSLPAPELVELC